MLIFHHAGHIAVLTTHIHTHMHTHTNHSQRSTCLFWQSEDLHHFPHFTLPLYSYLSPGIFPRLTYGDTGLSLKFVFRTMRVLTLSGLKAKLLIHKVSHHLAPTFTHTLASLMSLTIVFLLFPRATVFFVWTDLPLGSCKGWLPHLYVFWHIIWYVQEFSFRIVKSAVKYLS